MSNRIFQLVLFLLAILLLCSAKAKTKTMDFTANEPFRFGMQQQLAEDILKDSGNWKVTFRVDTPSTSEIACLYQEQTFFRLGFYEGECYSLEKRIQVPRAEVERIFTHFAETLGETGEATQSEDNSLYFSRWTKATREISLTADQGKGDIYKLTYEETDILKSGDARHAQQDELGSQPTAVDPITGKPRLLKPGEDGSMQGDENGDEASGDEGSDEEPSGDKPPPPSGAKGKEKGKAKGESDEGEDEKPKDENKGSGIGHDDPNDW